MTQSPKSRASQKIAVIGMGYVGIPAAVLLADAGYDVTGIQRRSKRSGWKIDWLNAGRSPIGGNEPELAELLAGVVKQGCFRVTDNYSVLKDIDIILIDVQTPTDEKHVPQYESLGEVCHQIGKYLKPGKLVIIESTVAPGTTEYFVKPILEEESGLKGGLPVGFGLCFSYERVMVGRLVHNIREYPKIVGSVDERSAEIAVEMYKSIVRGGVDRTSLMTAEVSKTVENAYRDVQIAFANEVGLLCESLGIDVYDVRKFVNGLPDDRSVPHANPVRNMLFPGAGVGGHCLPKDTWLLMYGYHTYGKKPKPKTDSSAVILEAAKGEAEGSGGQGTVNCVLSTVNSYPYPCSILSDARSLNDWMPLHMVDLLVSALKEAQKELKGSLIGVLGYGFLENSDDPRNTPTISLLKELEKRGARYKTHDPYIKENEEGFIIEPDMDVALEGCDAVILMTKHDQYKSVTPEKLGGLLRTRVVIDGRNLFDPRLFIAAGFVFKGVGKGNINKFTVNSNQ